MHCANQKGNVITYVIVAMTMAATLAVGMLYMGSSSTLGLGEITTNNFNRAYFLALAGKDYALFKTAGTERLNLNGRVFYLCRNNTCSCVGTSCSNLDKFSLGVTCNSNIYTINSIGVVNEGTPFEVKRKITITKADSCS